jgi:hypothetical protein
MYYFARVILLVVDECFTKDHSQNRDTAFSLVQALPHWREVQHFFSLHKTS